MQQYILKMMNLIRRIIWMVIIKDPFICRKIPLTNPLFNKPKWLIDEKIDLKRYSSGAWKVLNVEKRSIVNTYYEEWGSTSKPYCCQNIITKRNSERDNLNILYFWSAVNSSSKICSLKWSTILTLISSLPLSPIMGTL